MKKPVANINDSIQANNQSRWKDFLKIYLVLAVLFLVMFTMRATVTIIGVLLPNIVPDISANFIMTESRLAVIFTIYNMTAAFFSIFVGPITERIGYKIILYTGMFIFVIGIAITTFTSQFWVMGLAQGIAGIGAAFFGPATIAFAGEYFPKERISTAIGIIMSSFYVATIIIVPVNSYIALLLNWRWAVGIMGIIGGTVVVLIIFIIPKFKSAKQGIADNQIDNHSTTEDLSYIQRINIVLKNKFAVGTFFITLFQRGGLFAMTQILSTWLLSEFSLPTNRSGLVLMGSGIAALVSNSLFSWLADKKQGKRAIILIGTLLTGIWIGIFPLIAQTLGLAIFGFILLNFFGGISMGSYNAFVAEVMPQSRGTAVSINNTFGQISQALAVGIIVRIIYDRTLSYFYCGLVSMGFFLISIILMLIFVKPKEIEKQFSSNALIGNNLSNE
ncbi:MAG TPA: MFS transporter [Candidatus Bathyarchaeia archaeon]|nr:MFS transporter [Candidatus Bathyarchaeia archaeon]